MTTYTKEQLMLVSIELLQSLAHQFNTPHKDSNNQQLLVADILAIQESMFENPTENPPKKKRGRPSKAEIAAREATEALAKALENGNILLEENQKSLTSSQVSNESTDIITDTVANSNIESEARDIFATRFVKIDENFIITQDLPAYENTDIYGDLKGEEQLLDSSINIQSPTVSTHLEVQESPINQPINSKEIFLEGEGVLELTKEGYGFLRSADYNYLTSPDDIYVSPLQLRQYGLKAGDIVKGKIRVPRDDDKFFVLISVDTINGKEPVEVRNRIAFEHLTPIFPDEKFRLCCGTKDSLSRRIVDIFAPIGKGQRALIVAQPKTGKTMLMKEIANAIAESHPETYLIMLLIDERPEEVTDIKRTVNAEVIASTFDAPASNHVKIAGIVLEKAKRMVECGHDVVIFLDSITRLARAYNTEAPASGKILSGGVDANSLQRPKRFFGAARNIEGGGSLTIIATALIDTGSKMDEVIFEEFKGTGNMELQLDRQLANKRIFPAVNLMASSTRRDDLLLPPTTSNRMWVLRNFLSQFNNVEAMQEVIKQMDNTLNNEEMLITMGS